MQTKTRNQERGQILLMSTMGLVAMIGILALVVDIGLAYYQKKSAQKAADAASLAGAARRSITSRMERRSAAPTFPARIPRRARATITTPTTDPISVACLYAQQNGFTAGGAGGKQSVT